LGFAIDSWLQRVLTNPVLGLTAEGKRRAYLADNLSLPGLTCLFGTFASFCAECAFLLLLAPNLCNFARKTHAICIIKKSDVVCFQPLLSFVPSFFHLLRAPTFPNSPSRSGSRPGLGAPLRSPTTMCPHEDHDGRLSQVRELVKRKMHVFR